MKLIGHEYKWNGKNVNTKSEKAMKWKWKQTHKKMGEKIKIKHEHREMVYRSTENEYDMSIVSMNGQREQIFAVNKRVC